MSDLLERVEKLIAEDGPGRINIAGKNCEYCTNLIYEKFEAIQLARELHDKLKRYEKAFKHIRSLHFWGNDDDLEKVNDLITEIDEIAQKALKE